MQTMKRSMAPMPSTSKRIRLEEAEYNTSSDTESIWSLQQQSTDYVQDTEDTSSSSSEEDEGGRLRRKFILSTSEESEVQEIADLGAAVMGAVLDSKIDLAINADSSEELSTSPTSNSDVDPGLPRSDYPDFEECQMCRTDKKDISYPYCKKCYKEKKAFFPPRPKRRRKRNLLRSQKSGESSADLSGPSTSAEYQSSQDSGIGSQETEISVEKSPSESDSVNKKNLCEICLERRRNGLFVHGQKVHRYGCFKCAKNSWLSTGGCCPLCRKKVRQVLTLLNSDDTD